MVYLWQENETGYLTYHFDKRGSTTALTDESGKISGNAKGVQSVTEYLVGDKCIDKDIWKAAETANMAGNATQEQTDLLEAGHWLAK